MPAFNMGGTAAANPSAGHAVAMSAFSGPSGSPFDAKKYPSSGATYTTVPVADTANLSTGALCTGIGFGMDARLPGMLLPSPFFTDDYQPGITLPSGVNLANTVVASGLYGAVLNAIGGGKSTTPTAATSFSAPTVPYNVQPLLAFGNGGSRDAGAGPAFTGFGTKLVTAVAGVANGAVIETGWTNRSGVTLATGLSQFGSSTAASPIAS